MKININKINIFFVLSLFLILFNILIVSAQTSYFGFSLECFQGCDKEVANVKTPIMLKVIIKNNLDYWILVGDNSLLKISVKNPDIKNGEPIIENHQNFLGNPTYFPPKSEEEVYISFDTYNNLEENNRIGDWILKPELHLKDIKYYKNPFNEEVKYISTSYKISPITAGNQLKFESKAEDLEIQTSPLSKIINPIKNFFNKWIGYIAAGVIIIVISWLVTKRK
ncbi:hypothetical protein KAT24_00375 [Candidatus Pacearchaeota archaeon]|nr:hypothetical protein [Candidatus Pacearchaeota archaeon]